jgi:hypothetical protein
MKIFLCIILFLILIGCRDKSDIYADIAIQYYQTIQIIESQNNYTYSEFENQATNELRCSPKIIPWYNKTVVLRSSTDNVILLIDSVLHDLYKKYSNKDDNGTNNIHISFSSKSSSFDNYFLESLKKHISNFKDITASIVDNKRYESLINFNNKILTTTDWNEIPPLYGRKSSVYELVTCLYKVKADLKIVELNVLNYLYSQIETGDWKFYKIQVVVEPNALSILKGETYRANIFPAIYDTTLNISFEIEDKKIKSKNEIGKYTCIISEPSGKYTKNGNVLLKSFCTGKIQKIPFKIEYEVLEKK